MNAVDSKFTTFFWINNPNWFFAPFNSHNLRKNDFFVYATPGTYFAKPPFAFNEIDIANRLGYPTTRVICDDLTIWIYKGEAQTLFNERLCAGWQNSNSK